MTYIKNGLRKYKLEHRKVALKQIRNFSNIMENMNELDKALETYDGLLTKDNINEIAMLINKDKRLQLLEDQIKLVTRKYNGE